MLIFWQECKHILRSKFFWSVIALGIALAIFMSWEMGFNSDEFSMCYDFTEKNGTSFTEKDALKYVEYILEYTEEGETLQENLKKIGVEGVTVQEILAYYNGKETELGKKLEKFGMEAQTEENQRLYSDVVFDMEYFTNPFQLVEERSFPNSEDRNSQRESLLQSLQETLPEWKFELLQKGYEDLDKRAAEIVKNGENQYFLPLPLYMGANYQWFNYQFSRQAIIGFLWAFAFVLAGVAAARSLGGSLMGNLQGMVYTGKNGRRLVLYKLLAVLAVTGGTYLVFYLLSTLVYLFLFRLDLYWNVPLAALTDWNGPVVPRLAITIGGYWWFQLGVGFATVLIMALIFSAAMVLTKNFYAGSAISVGVSILLYGLIQIIPGTQNSMLLMGSPIGLFLNAGVFLQERLCEFYILPRFEGLSLLIWGGFAAILAVLGFVRFRKAAL